MVDGNGSAVTFIVASITPTGVVLADHGTLDEWAEPTLMTLLIGKHSFQVGDEVQLTIKHRKYENVAVTL